MARLTIILEIVLAYSDYLVSHAVHITRYVLLYATRRGGQYPNYFLIIGWDSKLKIM